MSSFRNPHIFHFRSALRGLCPVFPMSFPNDTEKCCTRGESGGRFFLLQIPIVFSLYFYFFLVPASGNFFSCWTPANVSHCTIYFLILQIYISARTHFPRRDIFIFRRLILFLLWFLFFYCVFFENVFPSSSWYLYTHI